MPQLDPTWFASQLFWLVVSFGLLYGLMSRLVLPPLLGIVQQRADAVSADLSAASTMRDEAERARQDYETQLKTTRERAQGLMDEAMAQQKKDAEEAGKRLEGEIAGKLSEAGRRIELKKQELTKALEPAVADLASLIVQKLTSRTPDSGRVSEALRAAGSVSQKG